MTAFRIAFQKVTPQQVFMVSTLVVNGGNYLYNLLLGRFLGPEAFAEAALLITLLLVLSFIGMTFQLTTTKFAVQFSDETWVVFKNTIYRYALFFGILSGGLIIGFSKYLKTIFNVQSHWIFIIFAVAVPLYFVMSVNRGKFQGRQEFEKLAATYQTEMWGRLILTFTLLYFVPLPSSILIAIGIGLSFIVGFIPSDLRTVKIFSEARLDKKDLVKVWAFIGLTAGYEFTQIIINNSDILLVKHYFNATEAGLYASLALIGRVVYFVAWMFVMLLLPTVIQKKKDGEATAPVLFKYILFIGILSTCIVGLCYMIPEIIIGLMFGDAYLSMAPLLWQYALATSLFAISNIFAYYFLSLDKYVPVILSGLLGLSQIVLIVLFHSSLLIVVQMQIIVMLFLLVAQLIFFSYQISKPDLKINQ